MSKNIVVCFDGTRNQNETQNTNVHCIYQMLDKECSAANYLSGVGVGGRFIGNALDALTGRGLFRMVRGAFTFVRGNYVSNDKIFIFGFSRGAYAARHLAGMIVRVGLGYPTEASYDRYRKVLEDEKQYQTMQDVTFLGMFDCVPGNQIYLLKRSLSRLNNPTLEPGIKNVAHAVSRQERRWSFEPLLFENGGQQSFQQAWFPGYHFDVGGDSNPPLNSFALWWMLREAYGHGLELTHIKCPNQCQHGWHHGKLGVKLGFMPGMDSKAPGKPHEYLTTHLGLRCDRPSLPGAKRVAKQPRLADLDVCPRNCGEKLFGYYLTDEGKRFLRKIRGRGDE